MTDSPTNIRGIFDQSADLVSGSFHDVTDVERSAMRCMFRFMRKELSSKKLNSEENNRNTAITVIEKIKPAYELYKLHRPNFFPAGNTADVNALSIAVICDEYTPHINEPAQQTDGDLIEYFHNDIDDNDAVITAQIFYEEACQLVGLGYDEQDPPAKESVCLALIQAHGNMEDLDRAFDDYDLDDLKKILQKDLPPLRTFATPATAFGETVLKKVDAMAERIESLLRPRLALPAPKRHTLRLVTPEQP